MRIHGKRCFSVFVILAMLVGLLPLSALPAAAANVENVTPETFFDFFDEDGTLLPTDAHELQFSGDFGDMDVFYITVDQSITLSSPNRDAEFDGSSFVITADGVTLRGLSITQSSDVSAITANCVCDVALENLTVDYTALEGFDSHAIYAERVEGLTVTGCTVYYVGNTDGTVYNNILRTESCVGVTVTDNYFEGSMPSVDIRYDEETWLPTRYNAGLCFNGCDALELTDNTVAIEYNDIYTALGYDSLFGIEIIDSQDENYDDIVDIDTRGIVTGNVVTLNGHAYSYGFHVESPVGILAGNTVTVTSETGCAYALYFDGVSNFYALYSDGPIAIMSNRITAEAPAAAYGFYAYSYMGPLMNVPVITDNVIRVADCHAGCGVYAYRCDDFTAERNTVTGEGDYLTGILFKSREGGDVSVRYNSIDLKWSGRNNGPTGDSELPLQCCGVLAFSKSLISGNLIRTAYTGTDVSTAADTGVGVLISDKSDACTVTDNGIDADGDWAVEDASGSAEVTGNLLRSASGVGDAAVSVAATGNLDPAENLRILLYTPATSSRPASAELLNSDNEAKPGDPFTLTVTLNAGGQNEGKLSVVEGEFSWCGLQEDPVISFPVLGGYAQSESEDGCLTFTAIAGTVPFCFDSNGSVLLTASFTPGSGLILLRPTLRTVTLADDDKTAIVKDGLIKAGASLETAVTLLAHPVIRDAALSGTAFTCTVRNVSQRAVLIVAWYADGRMLGLKFSAPIAADDGETQVTVSGLGTGSQYKAMLVDASTFVPLCPSWGSEA